MEQKNLKIEVIVKMRKNHLTDKEFKCFACKTKDEKWNDLKFTKDVAHKELPVSHSFIYVKPENLNRDTRGKFPVIWVKKIERVEQIERPLEDLTQYFEVEGEEPADLPF